jgi:hypothetical protein
MPVTGRTGTAAGALALACAIVLVGLASAAGKPLPKPPPPPKPPAQNVKPPAPNGKPPANVKKGDSKKGDGKKGDGKKGIDKKAAQAKGPAAPAGRPTTTAGTPAAGGTATLPATETVAQKGGTVKAPRKMTDTNKTTKAVATAPTKGRSLTKAQATAAFAPLVQEMHRVRVLLDRADRDYNGHRAAAVTEIGHAIGAVPHQGNSADRAAVEGGEVQALSDAQLRLAHQALVGIHGRLGAINHPSAPKAAGHIHNARRELEIALKIK